MLLQASCYNHTFVRNSSRASKMTHIANAHSHCQYTHPVRGRAQDLPPETARQQLSEEANLKKPAS